MKQSTDLIRSVLVVVALLVPCFVSAEVELALSPSASTVTALERFSVRVLVSADGQSINAIEGRLRYDPNMLEVTKVMRSGSILSSWTTPPRDDGDGTIFFGGATATATTPSQSLVFGVEFLPTRLGEAQLILEEGAIILAADGSGGNALTKLGYGSFRIVPEISTPTLSGEAPKYVPGEGSAGAAGLSEELSEGRVGEVLGAAVALPSFIFSDTHQDPGRWYQATTARMRWDSTGVLASYLALDQFPIGQGTVRYPPDRNDRIVTDLPEGVSYFHVTREFPGGKRETEVYTLRVDSVPPSLSAREVPRADQTDPNLEIAVNVSDVTSGIGEVYLGIDDEALQSAPRDAAGVIRAKAPPGEHVIRVVADDGAGNRAEDSLIVNVGKIASPGVVLLSRGVEGEPFLFGVQGPPGARVSLTITPLDKGGRMDERAQEERVLIEADGETEYTTEFIPVPGRYLVSAVASDQRGGMSERVDTMEVLAAATLSGVLGRHPFLPFTLLVFVGLLYGVRMLFVEPDVLRRWWALVSRVSLLSRSQREQKIRPTPSIIGGKHPDDLESSSPNVPLRLE